MMAHNTYQQMMSLALDGALAPPDEAALRHHLAECAACSAAWEAMSGLDALLGQAAMVSPPPDFGARVMVRVQAQHGPRRWPETLFWLAMMALVGVMALTRRVPAQAPFDVAPRTLPGPAAEFAGQLEPALETLRTVGATLDTLAEALYLWLSYVASSPIVWAAGLATLVLAATWVGLVEVFSPGEPPAAPLEAVRAS